MSIAEPSLRALEGSLGDVVDAYVGMSADELDGELQAIELERRRLEARMAAAVAVGEAKGVGGRDEHRSIKGYLRGTLGLSGVEAFRLVRRARLIDTVPEFGEAWFTGRIATSRIDTLANVRANPRCGGRLGEFADLLLDHAEHLEHSDFDIVMGEWEQHADPDGAFDETSAALRDRDTTVHAGERGIELHAHGGDPLQAAEMAAIFDRYVEAEFDKDVAARRDRYGDDAKLHSLPRTAAQRRSDALYQLFVVANAGAEAGLGPVAPATCVDIIFDAATFGETLARHGFVDTDDPFGVGDVSLLDRTCRTATGAVVDPDAALRAALTGHVRRVLVDSASVVIDQGTKSRLFTGNARVAAMLLATTCYHPGCQVPARFCDVDHLDEHHRGGRTDQHNAGVGCNPHNRAKHRRRFGARRAANGRVYTIRPDGTPMTMVRERPPTWHEPDPPTTDAGPHAPDRAPPTTDRASADVSAPDPTAAHHLRYCGRRPRTRTERRLTLHASGWKVTMSDCEP